MAMTKAEMEAHRDAYMRLSEQARLEERAGLYRAAMSIALKSWEYIDGMMQYERRYNKTEFDSIYVIDLVLKYAPLLLDSASLNTLESLLKDCRRIERNTTTNLADELSVAKSHLWNAHRLWDHIEYHPDCRQDELRQKLGGEQDQWRSIAECWEKMGLLIRTPDRGSYRLVLSTQMGVIVTSKCMSCGCKAEAPKAMFLEPMTCPECKQHSMFVILPTEAPAV